MSSSSSSFRCFSEQPAADPSSVARSAEPAAGPCLSSCACTATEGCTRRAPPAKWWGRDHIWAALPPELVPRLQVSCERCAAGVIARFCEEEGFRRCRTKSCFRCQRISEAAAGEAAAATASTAATWICDVCAEKQRARQRSLWQRAGAAAVAGTGEDYKCAHCSARIPATAATAAAGDDDKRAKRRQPPKKCARCLERSREVDRRRRERRRNRVKEEEEEEA